MTFRLILCEKTKILNKIKNKLVSVIITVTSLKMLILFLIFNYSERSPFTILRTDFIIDLKFLIISSTS